MMNKSLAPSPYRIMWLYVIYDLPTYTAAQRKAMQNFRKGLEEIGFFKVQNSKYTIFLPSMHRIPHVERAIKRILPKYGHLRSFCLTDAQYTKQQVHLDLVPPQCKRKKKEKVIPAKPYMLFDLDTLAPIK